MVIKDLRSIGRGFRRRVVRKLRSNICAKVYCKGVY